ncbi:hypothetical protein D920_01096 [Enterococcus faecalis 13-SD-W-01]|nr:hypothetical protein D920_01096 [Enterococcus faecalis 13-SD-W-01]
MVGTAFYFNHLLTYSTSIIFLLLFSRKKYVRKFSYFLVKNLYIIRKTLKNKRLSLFFIFSSNFPI